MLSQLKSSLQKSLLPSLTIFACALVMVFCSRLALGLLESQGSLSYIYATSGSGTILEQMCEIFTGTSVVALVAIGGIIGGMIAALLASAGWRFAQSGAAGAAGTTDAAEGDGRSEGQTSAQRLAPNALIPQFVTFALWTIVATILIVVVFALVFLGTISDVQFASVSSKLGGGGEGSSGGGSGPLLPLTLLMLWTLLLMGGSLVFAAVSVARGARRKALATALFLVIATLVVGVLLVFLSVALFTRFNVVGVDYAALNTWLGISIGANLAVTLGGLVLSRVFIGRK